MTGVSIWNRPAGLVGVIGTAILLLAGAVQLQAWREQLYPAREDLEATLYLRSGNGVKRLTGPLTPLAADLYWIRAIQHYGGTKRRLTQWPEPPPLIAADLSHEYALLHPLLDLVTTLDPQFKIAYRFGAVFLAEAPPAGPGRPDQAIALLEKGIRGQPDTWEYMEDVGFVHYWYRHDYQTAGEWFRRAGDVPGAPWWLKSLAATTVAQGGNRGASRLMWESIRQSAQIDWLRQDAERRLMQLNALDAIDALQERVNMFTRAAGHPPADWNDLVRARLLNGIPRDQAGSAFELLDGAVRLSPRSPLWPLPEHEANATMKPAA